MTRLGMGILLGISVIAVDMPAAFGESNNSLYRYRRVVRAKKKPNQRTRKLASLKTRNQFGNLKASAKRSRAGGMGLEIGIVSGYATTNTNALTEQVQRDGAGYNQNIYLGVEGDLRLSRFFGVDVEGYFGLVNSKAVSGTERSVQPYGMMGDVYGRIPFFANRNLKLVPRAGLGYGAHFLTESAVTNGVEAGQSTRVMAPYGVIGLEFVFFRRLTLSTDVAMSALGTGLFSPRTSQDQDVANPLFRRVRLGLDYRVSVPFSVGAQYTRRDLEFQVPGNTFTTNERTDQVLGVLKFHF